jgi:hypothetical protein
MTASFRPDPEAHFDRRAWLTLGAVLLLLGIGLAVLAYRFTLPTDGWSIENVGDADTFRYRANLMGAPSGLQPGDEVVSVGDFRNTEVSSLSLQRAWQAGATLTYIVIRDDTQYSVPVTLTHWGFRRWLRATLVYPSDWAGLLAGYLLLGISAFVFWRRPGNPAASAFLLLTTSLTTTDLVSATLPLGWPEVIDPVANVLTGSVGQTILYSILLPFALIGFALVFPRPKPILRRWPWLTFAPPLIGLTLSLLPGESPLGWLWFVLSILLMLALLTHTAFTARDTVGRAQVLWGLSGLIFGFGLLGGMLVISTLGLAGGFSQSHFNLASATAFTVIGLTLAIAITRYRLFDIDVIIRRTLVYAVITAVLALVYFGSVVILQSLLRGLTGGESPLVVVLSTLLIAALFAPVRTRVQRVIDRRFYRRKYDAARTLAAFGSQARDVTDLGQLSADLQATVENTMQPASVGLWLRPAGKRERP